MKRNGRALDSNSACSNSMHAWMRNLASLLPVHPSTHAGNMHVRRQVALRTPRAPFGEAKRRT